MNDRLGRLATDRAKDDPNGVEVLEPTGRGTSDPVTGPDQRELADLNHLTGLLPRFADHSQHRRFAVINAPTRQAPPALCVGSVRELRHQHTTRAGHQGAVSYTHLRAHET